MWYVFHVETGAPYATPVLCGGDPREGRGTGTTGEIQCARHTSFDKNDSGAINSDRRYSPLGAPTHPWSTAVVTLRPVTRGGRRPLLFC